MAVMPQLSSVALKASLPATVLRTVLITPSWVTASTGRWLVAAICTQFGQRAAHFPEGSLGGTGLRVHGQTQGPRKVIGGLPGPLQGTGPQRSDVEPA